MGEYNQKKYLKILDEVTKISKDVGCSVSAIALAWLRQQKSVSVPIASARTVEQLNEIVQVIRLSELQSDVLTNISNDLHPQENQLLGRMLKRLLVH